MLFWRLSCLISSGWILRVLSKFLIEVTFHICGLQNFSTGFDFFFHFHNSVLKQKFMNFYTNSCWNFGGDCIKSLGKFFMSSDLWTKYMSSFIYVDSNFLAMFCCFQGTNLSHLLSDLPISLLYFWYCCKWCHFIKFS